MTRRETAINGAAIHIIAFFNNNGMSLNKDPVYVPTKQGPEEFIYVCGYTNMVCSGGKFAEDNIMEPVMIIASIHKETNM